MAGFTNCKISAVSGSLVACVSRWPTPACSFGRPDTANAEAPVTKLRLEITCRLLSISSQTAPAEGQVLCLSAFLIFRNFPALESRAASPARLWQLRGTSAKSPRRVLDTSRWADCLHPHRVSANSPALEHPCGKKWL